MPLNGSAVVAVSGSGWLPFNRRHSSDKKRVSRKMKPCGRPGSMSPERDDRQNAEPSTRVTTPSVPPRLALALVVHGSGIPGTVLPPRRRTEERGRSLAGMRIALVAPGWFPVPPSGYGGIELVVALLADGLVEQGHDVTLYAAAGSRTKANLVSDLPEPPERSELGNPWYDAFHALSTYVELDGFDLVHDHAGVMGPVCGAMLRGTPPVVHTLHGPWTEGARLLYGVAGRYVHLVAISDAQ